MVMRRPDSFIDSTSSQMYARRTKQVSKEAYYRGKRDLLCADFESLPSQLYARRIAGCAGKSSYI